MILRFANHFRLRRWPLVVPAMGAFAALYLPSAGLHGQIGAASPLAGELVVSELNYNPLPPDDGEMAAGFSEADDFEFIELRNQGAQTLSLSGVRFMDGVEFDFTGSPVTSLAPDGFVVVVRNRLAFQHRYGADAAIAGVYDGGLKVDGETIGLVDAEDRTVLEFTYGASLPDRANGSGSTLQLKNPEGDPNDPGAWMASIEYLGTPGKSGLTSLDSLVINEVLAHTDLPLEDAIELCNPTGEPIDVGGWFLSDSVNELKRYRIPEGTVIEAQGFHVFYEIDFNITNSRVPFALNSVEGEDVYLTAADAGGNLTLFVDEVHFPASENGVSFGRYPDIHGDLTPLEALTFGSHVARTDPENWITLFRQGEGAPNSPPKVGPIVINRIMYHPLDGDFEFVELLNVTDQETALYDPLHPTNSWSLANAIEYTFPGGTSLAPGEKLIVLGEDPNGAPFDPENFRQQQELPGDFQLLGPFGGRLDNAGESLELFKPDPPQTQPPDEGFVPRIPVETIDYDDEPPWPEDADGANQPLRRIDPAAFGNDPANWTTAAESVSDPPELLGVEVLSDGMIALEITAERGATVAIDATENFELWDEIARIPITGARDSLSPFAPANSRMGFYRARLVP